MKTGRLIKELRIKKGMTQEELADKTEVSSRTIQRIENGEVDPRAYTLQMIAKALEVDYDLFVDEESSEQEEINQASNYTWLGLLHFSAIIPLIFPTVLIWHAKKDKVKGMSDHYRDVISHQLMWWIIIIATLWIYWKADNVIPLIIGFIVNAMITIVSTIKVVSGEPYKNFFAGRKDKK